MCGICGKYSTAGVREEELQRMLQAIAHRGPDDEGLYINEQIGLGNRRLSIIDLPGGHQPMYNEDESIWIVYNGEIYNYKFLRRDLEQKGHLFKTNSDTEVIVHLYEDLGERCVEKLSGMFAFAIWDQRNQKLYLARDRIGQKPLFYVYNDKEFLFASEIKAILASKNIQRQIDFESVFHYLSTRFIPSPGTMFCDIKKLPAAHYLVLQNGHMMLRRYWNISFTYKQRLSEAEFAEGLKSQLKETVRSHLVGDVSVGAFLSGGLDSSTIVAMMADTTSSKFNTFTIGVKEQDFNELPFARMVANHHRTNHIEKSVKFNLIKSLPQIIWHLDEPSDPIAACMFKAAELASQYVKVVLGGDGGDELFGGFDRYLGVERINFYDRFFNSSCNKILALIISLIPENFAYKSFSQKLRWVHQVSNFRNNAERYAEASFFFRFNHNEKKELFTDPLWSKLFHYNSADLIIQQFNKPDAENIIDKMIYADLMTRLPDHSLMLTDRMTMAHGLEARSPFLDHQLIEYLASFPSDLKIRGSELKYILRKISKEFLPKKIVRRKKQGFMFPFAYWFRNELYMFTKNIFQDFHLVKEGVFKKESILRSISDHKAGKIDNHVRIWILLNLELWYRIYIEGQPPDQVTDNILGYF